MPKVVVIDGTIGVGKTSVLTFLQNLGFVVFKEPIEIWQSLLELRQQDPKRWALTFQITVLNHFLALEAQIKQMTNPVVFIERCGLASWAFTHLAYEKGELSDLEYTILTQLFKNFQFHFDKLILLDAPLNVCLDRIQNRGRRGEELISLQFLKDLARNYDLIFQNKEKIILNATRPISEIALEILSLLLKN